MPSSAAPVVYGEENGQSSSGNGFLAVTGTPPFSPFWSEFMILNGAIGTGRHVVAGLFLFVLALELLKKGAGGIGPLLRQLGVSGVTGGTGVGWLAACLLLSGSPVAAMALTLLASGTLTTEEKLHTFSLGLQLEHPVFTHTRVFAEYELMWLGDDPYMVIEVEYAVAEGFFGEADHV